MEQETEKSMQEINQEKLISFLTCVLCKGIYRIPTTINECMHTFCKKCIYQWFSNDHINPQYSCPICLVNLGGHPKKSLIFDTSLSQLIDIVFPEYESIDKENKQIMKRLFNIDDSFEGDNDVIILLGTSYIKENTIDLQANGSMQYTDTIYTKVMDIKEYICIRMNLPAKDIELKYNEEVLPSDMTIEDIFELYKVKYRQGIIFIYSNQGTFV